ncbi:MAG: hypothetical protein WAP20_04570 [Limnochordia bacterium]|jgi:DnaJ-class molecular chaperone|nr:hypothetical protein [Bacillota bacterium]HOB08587.1 hypothetical protein [Limnochordia bacterium]NLH31275.1 hypothetical protein [Bacillota bacterium]HPT92735.1 hypothetical protein [Limnochordia bacterium]HPZ30728.1 hypothetical protein [Limnochordia bacterium]
MAKGVTVINKRVIDEPEADLPDSGSNQVCSTCKGNLYVECSCTEGYGPENAYFDCPYCGGTGATSCPNCNPIQI